MQACPSRKERVALGKQSVLVDSGAPDAALDRFAHTHDVNGIAVIGRVIAGAVTVAAHVFFGAAQGGDGQKIYVQVAQLIYDFFATRAGALKPLPVSDEGFATGDEGHQGLWLAVAGLDPDTGINSRQTYIEHPAFGLHAGGVADVRDGNDTGEVDIGGLTLVQHGGPMNEKSMFLFCSHAKPESSG